MKDQRLVELALGDISPWYVESVVFDESEAGKELHVYLSVERGTLFDGKKAHDFKDRTWRHLNFFEHRCYLHARVPRLKMGDGSVKTYTVPWARRNLGFTLKFEALLMFFLKGDLPVNQVAEMIGEGAQQVWDVFNHWIEKSYEEADHSKVTTLVIDETSRKKGHEYITVAIDAENRRVVRCEAGKDSAAVERVQEYLKHKGCSSDQIKDICMDMSPAYISGCKKAFPKAQLTYDRFHVMQMVNKALDTVRRLERRETELLKGQRYTVLRNYNNLSRTRKEELNKLLVLFPKLGESYRLKELIRYFWEFREEGKAKMFLYEWLRECEQSRIKPFEKVAESIARHWTGITNFTLSRLTSGVAESINRKIQTVKRLARGFRNPQNFINMIYYKCGNLSIQFPHF